ncbi:MAG: hypothetical protein ACK56F_13715 [bacterium]
MNGASTMASASPRANPVSEARCPPRARSRSSSADQSSTWPANVAVPSACTRASPSPHDTASARATRSAAPSSSP